MTGPALSTIPNGWRLLRTGKIRSGFRYWSERLQAWLPVTGSEYFHGSDASDSGEPKIPTIIKRGKA